MVHATARTANWRNWAKGLCAEYGPHMNPSHPPRWCRISVSTRVMRVLMGIHRAILIGGRPARASAPYLGG